MTGKQAQQGQGRRDEAESRPADRTPAADAAQHDPYGAEPEIAPPPVDHSIIGGGRY